MAGVLSHADGDRAASGPQLGGGPLETQNAHLAPTRIERWLASRLNLNYYRRMEKSLSDRAELANLLSKSIENKTEVRLTPDLTRAALRELRAYLERACKVQSATTPNIQ
jgi:hypothetical protein